MSFITAFVTGKVAIAALALGAVATGGTVAAYAGVLPTPVQQVAHTVIGAPSSTAASDESPVPGDNSTPTVDPTETPSPTPTDTPSAKGPDATGPAAFGLCTAFTHGGLSANSTAYASLATAAGGAAGIPAYCAVFVSPSPTAVPTTQTDTKTKPVHPTHPVHPVHPVKPVHP
ncbi:MAG: hypothetical protein QOF79_1992 [Actinomycetota bacterium]|jgi:hypothetical protein|nr:hypothetical protein [Actinomycetota bacterium]